MIHKSQLNNQIYQCYDPPACHETKIDYHIDQGLVFDLGNIPEQLQTKYCNVEENLDTKRLVPDYNEVFLKVIEAKNGFNKLKLKILNENNLPHVVDVINQAKVPPLFHE